MQCSFLSCRKQQVTDERKHQSPSNKYQDDALLLESELSNLNYLKSQLDDPSKRNDYLPAFDAENSALQRVIEKYNDAKMQYDESLTIHGENNPATKRLAQSLESAREGVNVVVKKKLKLISFRQSGLRFGTLQIIKFCFARIVFKNCLTNLKIALMSLLR